MIKTYKLNLKVNKIKITKILEIVKEYGKSARYLQTLQYQIVSKTFDYWIKLSTLEKGKPIYLPIKSNNYFENIKGKLKKIGKSIITNKLNQLKKEYGIKITEINPAYTSQPCSNCGCVSMEKGTII